VFRDLKRWPFPKDAVLALSLEGRQAESGGPRREWRFDPGVGFPALPLDAPHF